MSATDPVITGMVDSKGVQIRPGDIISVYHEAEEVKYREYQYKVLWSRDRAAFVLVTATNEFSKYLGEVTRDPNCRGVVVRWGLAPPILFPNFKQGSATPNFRPLI